MQIKPGLEAEYEKYKEINSHDEYSARVVSYSEDWANLMETQLKSDPDVSHCAEQTSQVADTDGITGLIYDCAITGLHHFWVHGDELLKWHNRGMIKDEAKADAMSAEGKQVSTSIFTIGG